MKRFLLACLLVVAIATPAEAQTCVVNDPTGTPLNVRTSPNGAILGALYNGAVVQVLKVIFDKRGRSWALVVPLEPGKQGWVFGAFLTCGR